MTCTTLQIRSSVFETNSSSSHSLTLGKSVLAPMIATEDELRSGTMAIYLGEYGWEYHRYYTPRNKLAYLATQVKGRYDTEDDTAFNASISDGPLQMIKDFVMSHIGCKVEFHNVCDSYIDHESYGVGVEVFESQEALAKFLLSPDAYIETGNDNSEPGETISTDLPGGKEWYARPLQAEVAAKGTAVTFGIEFIPGVGSHLTHKNRVVGSFNEPELLKALLTCQVKAYSLTILEDQDDKYAYLREECPPKLLTSVVAGLYAGVADEAEDGGKDLDFKPVLHPDCTVTATKKRVPSSEFDYHRKYADKQLTLVLPAALKKQLLALPELNKEQMELLTWSLKDKMPEDHWLAPAKTDPAWIDESARIAALGVTLPFSLS